MEISSHFGQPFSADLEGFHSRFLSLPMSLRATLVLDLETIITNEPDLEILKYYSLCFQNLCFKELFAFLKGKGFA
tara:strand:- start:621 stop:848 length:228 start_codon:yes stop_codon:yes gene_type:complete